MLTMGRRSFSDLLGIEKGRSKLLDGVSVSYSSQFENIGEIADSSLAAFDFSQMRISNGLKHSVSASSSSSLGFLTLAPSLQYDEFMSFSQLDKSLVYDVDGNIIELNDTLGGFSSDRDWRASISANTRFYGMFSFGTDSRIQAIRHVLTPSLSLSYSTQRTRTQMIT